MNPRPLAWAISDDGMRRVFAMRADYMARAEKHEGKPRAEWDDGEDGPPDRPAYTITGGTAHIPICGVLFSSMDLFDWIFCGGCTYGEIIGAINQAVADPAVAAIVLDIDSPGGEVAGCAETAAIIRAAAARKPITARAVGDCCSAAYWLASAAQRIDANAGAVVGSIGVRCDIYDDREALKKWGVERHTLAAAISPRKVIDFDAEDGLADIQALIDDLGEAFVQAVAKYRGVSREKVINDYGKGASMSAPRALAAGLIDAIVDPTPQQIVPAPQPATQTNPAPGRTAAPTQEAAMPTPNASGAIDAGADFTALAADLGCEANPQAVAQAIATLRQGKAQAEAEAAQARAVATANEAQLKAQDERIKAVEAENKDRTVREQRADLHAMLDRYEGGDTPRLQPGKREEMVALYGQLTVLGHAEAMKRTESVILAMPPAARLAAPPVRPEGSAPRDQQEIAAMAADLVASGKYARRGDAMRDLSAQYPGAARVQHFGQRPSKEVH